MTNKVFTAEALAQVKRLARQSKTIEGMTFEQASEQVSRDGMAWLQVFQALHFLQSNPLVTVSPSALDFVRIVAELARNGNMADGVEQALQPVDGLLPKGKVGVKFTAGRKSGTVGTVRGWIRKYMKKYPTAKPAQAWEAFTKRPPRGCTVSGSDIWTDGAGGTSRAWFGTMVGQERPKK